MHGLLTGRTVLLTGSLDGSASLIALPLAAAGAAVAFAGPGESNCRQLVFDIHRAGGAARWVAVDGSDFATLAAMVDLTITIQPFIDAPASAAARTIDESAGRTTVEQRPGAIIEAGPVTSPDDGTGSVRWTIHRRETLSYPGADRNVAPRDGVRAGAPAAVAGEVLRWAFDVLLACDATPVSTSPRGTGATEWDDEARADDELNFELA